METDGFTWPPRAALAPELAAEVSREPRWMFPWQLTPEVRTPVLSDELPSVHGTRREMLEPPVRAVLDARGGTATVVDVAGNEGYFAHQLLRWGAGRATCIDIRDVHVRRATLVREHFGVPADRLVVESGDVFALDHDRLGSFDVVLVLGLIYHVENPMGALRRARRLTAPGGVCIVESQLTEQREPIRYGGGLTDYFLDAEASFAAIFEAEQDSNPLASSGGVLSLVPNAAAFELMMRTAGFADVEWLSARPDLNPQYVHRHRGMLAGRVD